MKDGAPDITCHHSHPAAPPSSSSYCTLRNRASDPKCHHSHPMFPVHHQCASRNMVPDSQVPPQPSRNPTFITVPLVRGSKPQVSPTTATSRPHSAVRDASPDPKCHQSHSMSPLCHQCPFKTVSPDPGVLPKPPHILIITQLCLKGWSSSPQSTTTVTPQAPLSLCCVLRDRCLDSRVLLHGVPNSQGACPHP